MIQTYVGPSIDRSKDGVAKRLAEAHYQIEPQMEKIIRLVRPEHEEDPKEPIKLLEVNPVTTMSGIVPIYFGPHAAKNIFFPSVIVEICPEELESIRHGDLLLPEGWQLGQEYDRPGEVL